MKKDYESNVAFPERLSLREVLTVPLSLRPNIDFEKAQRAYRLMRRQEAAINSLRRKRERTDRSRLRNGCSRAGLVQAVDQIILDEQIAALERLCSPEGDGLPTVVLSSSMLKASFEYCTQDRREGLHYILGVEHDAFRVGTEMRTFPYSVQTVVAATGDIDATHRIAIELHDTGHCQVAMLHSHPGMGRNSNEPSGTDLRTQRAMELSSLCVGGIWSRDGNLRFYGKLASSVVIVGTQMEKQDDGTWQLISESNEADTPEVREAEFEDSGI